MSFPPLVTPAASPLDAPDAYVLPRTVGDMIGKGRVRDAVTRGLLRPADIDTAELSSVELVYVPLWRFEGSVDGFHIGLGTHTDSRGRTRPMPEGGFRHRDDTLFVCARRDFPIDPSAEARAPRADLVRVADHPLEPSERVEPDLPREEAEKRARQALRREGEPRSALYAKVEVAIRDAALVYYPLFVLRYRYGGDAVEGGPAIFFAALSGTTGKIVASHHPSALRSLGSKIRRLFGP